MKSLLNVNSNTNQETRLQLQKLMNQNFLRFQMKEKGIKKDIEKQKKLAEESRHLKNIDQSNKIDR